MGKKVGTVKPKARRYKTKKRYGSDDTARMTRDGKPITPTGPRNNGSRNNGSQGGATSRR